MDQANQIEGGCQCGAVRYVVTGDPVVAAICHCSMCRRASAAPSVAWAMYPEGQVRSSKAPLKIYASSPEAQRGFCEVCGTQISFTASFLPGLIDITIGSLDDPEAVPPVLHSWHSKHLSWAEYADTLPRHPKLPPFE